MLKSSLLAVIKNSPGETLASWIQLALTQFLLSNSIPAILLRYREARTFPSLALSLIAASAHREPSPQLRVVTQPLQTCCRLNNSERYEIVNIITIFAKNNVIIATN
jgi:hypothetical protein